MRALVTGADGFVGRWLVAHLKSAGDEVYRAVGQPELVSQGVPSLAADVRDPEAMAELVAWADPEAIYHLAAVAFGPDAQRSTGEAVQITVGGTVNLLDAARRLPEPPIVLLPGSADVYGHPPADGPLDETCPVAPVTLYGGTKAAQEAVGLAYHRAGLVPVIVTRSFNHIGPGQRDVFVVPSFAMQLADIARGQHEPVIHVGNLGSERDLTDVRDVVAAYRLLVVGRHAGEPVNVASGRAVSVRAILDQLLAISRLKVEIRVDPDRVRAVDPPRIVGDASRLRELTGWRPQLGLEASLADVWDDALLRGSSSVASRDAVGPGSPVGVRQPEELGPSGPQDGTRGDD